MQRNKGKTDPFFKAFTLHIIGLFILATLWGVLSNQYLQGCPIVIRVILALVLGFIYGLFLLIWVVKNRNKQ